MASSTEDSHHASRDAPPVWTYPTRFCRICREDVPPTVTMYPPGLPPYLQRPIVEYVNADEYGRLIKPCLCRGGMRYIHELCLLRSRTENNRVGSMWQCHECKHKFNFQRLAVQKWLGSKFSATVLTIMVMITIMFTLGFIADPIINIYTDPYETLVGDGPLWNEVNVRAPATRKVTSGWSQHFFKGFVSMGLVGFLKTLVLNPIHWWNYRQSGFVSSRTTSTGRDRAVNISWIAVVIGVSSAFYFFYQWVQKLIQRTLQRVGNNIVNTQLPGDDDDLKPPPGWKPAVSPEDQLTSAETSKSESASATQTSSQSQPYDGDNAVRKRTADHSNSGSGQILEETPNHNVVGSWVEDGRETDDRGATGQPSVVQEAISQGWSFADL